MKRGHTEPETLINSVEQVVKALSVNHAKIDKKLSNTSEYYYKQGASCYKRQQWEILENEFHKVFDDFNKRGFGHHNTSSPILSKIRRTEMNETERTNILKEKIFSRIRFLDIESHFYHLYCIDIKCILNSPEVNIKISPSICSPENSFLRMGILIPNEMPPIPKFSIYANSGEIQVAIKGWCRNCLLYTSDAADE